MIAAELIVPGNLEATLRFATEHWITTARTAIEDHGAFFVALSGGSTPKAIYELLASSAYRDELTWDAVHCFWSDERAVPPTDPQSNYLMATKAALKSLPIPPKHIHRMVAEEDREQGAVAYEKMVRHILKGRNFDLVMLGVGEDGHTASLFPNTAALSTKGIWFTPNFVPTLQQWRMTMTLECINLSHLAVIYALGSAKQPIIREAFSSEPHLPCQFVGTPDSPALWIADDAAVNSSGTD
jgi:6-phosphogluconolactonase